MGIRRLGLGGSSQKQSPPCQSSTESTGASTSGGAQQSSVDDMSANFIDAYKHRIRTLETENRRLMATRGNIICETNRRLEAQMAECRALKDDNRRLHAENKELKDMCLFLQDERDKTQRLSDEWQKFGRYTSQLMKQEIKAYQKRMCESETRNQQLLMENEELKRLCLYLDEQRQVVAASDDNQLVAGIHDDNSSDAGCGSSARSSDSELSPREHEPPTTLPLRQDGKEHRDRPASVVSRNEGYSQEKEKTLQMITQQMQTSVTMESIQSSSASSQVSHEDRLFSYVQSLENRIRQLEEQQRAASDRLPSRIMSATTSREQSPAPHASQNLNATWPSLAERRRCSPRPEDASSSEPPATALHAAPSTALRLSAGPAAVERKAERGANAMADSMTTSTMTSSGTTYCSSDTDESAATAVFVIGDELDNALNQLEVRTLGPIDEEEDEDSSAKGDRSEQDEESDKYNLTADNAYRVPTPKILSDTVVTYRARSMLGSPRRNSDNRDSNSTTTSQEAASTRSASSSEPQAENDYDDDLPPKMPLIGETCRLSLCSSDISLDRFENGSTHSLSPSFRSASRQTDSATPLPNFSRVTKKGPPPYSRIRVRPPPQPTVPKKSEIFPHSQVLSVASSPDRSRSGSSLSNAVKVLRIHELAAQTDKRTLNEEEAAIVQQMCEVAWNSLDRKSRSGSSDSSGATGTSSSESQDEYVITARFTSI